VWNDTAPIIEQIEQAIRKVSKKFNAFIVYLQPYSNTYGTVQQLSSIYEAIISFPRVVGLAIGTRPDCFSQEIFDYLQDVSRRTYLNVEVGLQSAHEETLKLNHRGHSMEDFRMCVRELSGRGIPTVGHVMLGLPPETEQMMLATAREIARLPVTGIKIHQLMIIRGTLLHQWYLKRKIECLTLQQYAKILSGFLSNLRSDQLIHRIVADSSIEKGLVAPLWSANKLKTLQFLKSYMDKEGTRQGEYWKK
jgi:radical SAM protein (TIGR01212 family)